MFRRKPVLTVATRAIVVFILAAVLLGVVAPGASARHYSFRCETYAGEGGAVAGQYSAHWYNGYCGYDAVYLDSTAQRVTIFDNQCDIMLIAPVDQTDVNSWISYASGDYHWYGPRHVAYMTASGDLKYSQVVPGAGGEYVDTTGVVGAENSIALDPGDPDGLPSIVYRDLTRHALKFARPRWVIEVVDSTGDTGHGPSLAFDAAHVAHVSYARHLGGPSPRDQVVYATRTQSGWVFETAGYFPAGAIATPTSLALSGSEAWIAFGDHVTGALRLGHRVSGAWTWSVIDPAEGGAWASLRISTRGFPFIAYFDELNGDLKLASQDSTGWTIQRADSTGVVGQYPWLRVDGEWPSISYYDATNGDLRLALTGLIGGVPGAGGRPGTTSLSVHPSPMRADGATIELRGRREDALHAEATPRAMIHDIRGRLIATVPLARDVAGTVRWSGRWNVTDAGGSPAPAGIYFVSVRSGDGVARAKIMVLR